MNKAKIITPVGKASWPHLHEPSTFGKPEDARYDCSVLIPEEEASEFIQRIKQLYEEGLTEAIERAKTPKEKRELREAKKNLPIKKFRDQDDNMTGEVEAKAKNKSQPLVVDAAGVAISPKVGSGSKIRMSTIPKFFGPINGNNYLTLTLLGVQVIDLVEWGAYGGVPETAKDAGFDVVDGYTTDKAYSGEDEDDEDDFETPPSSGEGDDNNADDEDF